MKFFNSASPASVAIQAYNLTAAAVTAHHYLTDTEANLAEDGSDIVVHLMNYYALNGASESFMKELVVFALNCMRLGSIYTGVTGASTQFSFVANSFDALGHAVSAVVGLCPPGEEKAPVGKPS